MIFNQTSIDTFQGKLKRFALGATCAGLGLFSSLSFAADTIKVGVLHSLSGTMAISETTLKDTVLMLVDEQNKKGGVLGKKLEAVVVDPASNWPLFAEKARELLTKEKVDVVFGCWTSVSRKSVLPVFEELNGLLFYPVQYEGEESSKNVFYTGAAPNQQAIPAVDYLMNDLGVKRWVLAGTDYVYPRTTNKILEAYLKAKGVKQADAEYCFRYQEVWFGRQENRGCLDNQWRRQCAFLQGTGQPGRVRREHSGCCFLGG
jgi:urea transport system substrate-binding protein